MGSKASKYQLANCKVRIRTFARSARVPAIRTYALVFAAVLFVSHADVAWSSNESQTLQTVARSVQLKVVKLYGAGGFQGLESYQSGMLVSNEGHVLTVWSYVLDADDIVVVLDDGRRFTAKHVAADPLSEIALLKFDPGDEKIPHFDLSAAVTAEPGTRVLAFSNLFGIATGDEPVSMLHGVISALAPLDARRGAYASNFRGEVYVVDAAANNPGAAGGALTDSQGRLLGMLGKELRSGITGTWLNYAIPVAAFESTVSDMQAGRFTPPEVTELDRPDNPQSLAKLGIVLVPDVVMRTPPYIDRILPDSPAARAGLQTDDLLVTVNAQVAASCRDATKLIERLESDAPVQVAVLRDSEFLEFMLSTADTNTEESSTEASAENPLGDPAESDQPESDATE
jgi:serine protease Do